MTSRLPLPLWARPTAFMLAAAAAGAVVWFPGGAFLPLPSGWGPAAWSRWWSSAGPLVAVFAVARVLVVVAAAGLTVGSGLLTLTVMATGGRNLACRMLSSWRVPGWGPVLRLAVGLTASGVAVAACGTTEGGAAVPAPPPPTLTNLGPVHGAVPPPAVTARPAATPVAADSPQVAADAPPVAADVPRVPPPAARPLPSGPLGAPAASGSKAASADSKGRGTQRLRPPPVPGRWRVGPGDSLWSIAESAVGPDRGRVVPYWLELIRANRATLPDPADPSLLFPGDTVVMPPVSPDGP